MRAVVVGAGLGGLACAHALVRHGWDVHVLEAAPGPREGGYMIDFFGAGYDAAERLGVLAQVRAAGHLFTRLAYVDAGGRETSSLDIPTLAESLDGRYVSILRPEIEAVLAAALPAGARVEYGRPVRRVDPGETTGAAAVVTCASGSHLSADLVVGADGLRSRVRAAVAPGDHVRPMGYRTGAWVHADPPLAARLGSTVVLSDSLWAQVGLYRVDAERVAGFVVERTEATGLPAHPGDYVRTRFAGLGAVFDRGLAGVPDDPYLDLVAQSVVPRWHRGRVVLVGDAAHAVSLLAGQGASLAIAGGCELADVLAAAPDLDTGLAAYEHRWRPVVERHQGVGRRAAGSFVPRTPLGLAVRRGAVSATRWGPLRRLTARFLVGKQGRRT